MLRLLILLFLYCFNCLTTINALKCVDESGNRVDWYVLYKLPRLKSSSIDNQLIKDGEAYMYMTSDDFNQWKLSTVSITDKNNSFLAKTLANIYEQKTSKDESPIMHVFYNDEPVNGPKKNLGHTKGVISGDRNEGFWMVHSIPKFPPPSNESYIYPSTGTVYGQSILCLSLSSSSVNSMGLQLMYNQIEIYSSSIPNNNEMKSVYGTIEDLIGGKRIEHGPWYRIQNGETLGGQNFVSFAKSKLFDKELYEDLVAPYLNSNLLVESWLNGPGKLSSNCTRKFSVKNVKKIRVAMPEKIAFPASQDHSKWSIDEDAKVLCIGDINREDPQRKRGGGTVCLFNENLSSNYKKIIGEIENCAI